MEVTVTGRGVEVAEEVGLAAREKVGKLSRFLDDWETADVHFSEQRNPRIAEREVCEVTLHGHGHVVRAKASSPDAMASLDRVIDKLEHQVVKLKGRLMARTHPRHRGRAVIDQGVATEIDDADDAPGEEPGPQIVKVKRFFIKPMTAVEAAMQMEMMAHSFYFFTNSETGQAAVVYRRDDGEVGLIDADG